MFSIRNARLVVLAFILSATFLFVTWSRPLRWNPALDGPETGSGSSSEKIPTIPHSDTDRNAHHGSAPPGASIPKPPPSPAETEQDDEDDGYDFKRPTDTSQAGSPIKPDSPKQDLDITLPPAKVACPHSYESYMRSKPGPPSTGIRQFPLVRPPPECRTYRVPAVDSYIKDMESSIEDPDLYRLFENSFPNTLDTMVKWHGYAQDETGNETAQELSYIITGDIDAMWLRDSASQLYSYLSFLSPHNAEGNDDIDSLNSLWRGLINSHSRYIRISPYCHSFQPPPESGIPPTRNGAYAHNNPRPAYDPKKVFDCKWELDSLASFLQVSVGYWTHTHDLPFFARYDWIDAVREAVDAAGAMRVGTYDDEGRVLPSAWTFTGWTNRGSETLTNDGLGNPVRSNGMVRTAFRPSDDATIFQLLVPSNMMWAKYLEEASVMMEEIGEGAVHPVDPEKQEMARDLTVAMREMAFGIRQGIESDAIVTHREFGDIFAYEVDGFGGVNLMDDANVPSLLSMPLFKYAESRFPLPDGAKLRDYRAVYQNTRRFVLSLANPYYAQGPSLSAVGGPHLGPGKAWPMAALVAGLTAFDEESGYADDRGKPLTKDSGSKLETEVADQLQMVLDSTGGYGVVHESVDSWKEGGRAFSRAWFGWANGLMGELVIRMQHWEKTSKSVGLLARSWQE